MSTVKYLWDYEQVTSWHDRLVPNESGGDALKNTSWRNSADINPNFGGLGKAANFMVNIDRSCLGSLGINSSAPRNWPFWPCSLVSVVGRKHPCTSSALRWVNFAVAPAGFIGHRYPLNSSAIDVVSVMSYLKNNTGSTQSTTCMDCYAQSHMQRYWR